jgi:hypothetical protein
MMSIYSSRSCTSCAHLLNYRIKMLCVLIDCVAPDWSDICWATQLFPEIALCARVFDVFRPYDVDDIFFFIDRSIYRIRWAESDVTKSRAFYCNPTIFSVGAKLFSFIWFLFSFFFFFLSFVTHKTGRWIRPGEAGQRPGRQSLRSITQQHGRPCG